MRWAVLLPVLGLIAAPAAGAESGGGAAPPLTVRSGGAPPHPVQTPGGRHRRPTLAALDVPAAAYGPRPAVTVTLQLTGRTGARVALVLLPAGGAGAPLVRTSLGRVAPNRTVRVRWALGERAAGTYVVRLAGRVRRPAALAASAAGSALTVRSARPARFPVAGAHSFGGPDARFGAGRTGHVHQGQDITAAEGTPIVNPVAGRVVWRADQPGGAGLYLVVRAGDGHDHVFMHLRPGSIRVDRGDAVRTGQRLAEMGHTGDATGPHLHFEVWVGGWQANGGRPIDPLPLLMRWDAWS